MFVEVALTLVHQADAAMGVRLAGEIPERGGEVDGVGEVGLRLVEPLQDGWLAAVGGLAQ